MAFRLIGIPIIAVAAVFIYRGLRDHFVLPECDSERAKQTLAEIFKQLKFEPLRYEPIKTISTSKDEVVCNAVLPLPDGASVVADYTFYWQGNKANMKYSIHRQAPQRLTPIVLGASEGSLEGRRPGRSGRYPRAALRAPQGDGQCSVPAAALRSLPRSASG